MSTSAKRIAAAQKNPGLRWSEYLTEHLLAVDQRMDNWARWAFERIGGAGHCGSIEHKYVPTRDDERGDVLQRQMASPIDALDGMFVESCVVTLPARCRERVFLGSYYLRRAHWRQVCRVLRINPDLFPSVHVRTLTVAGAIIHVSRPPSLVADTGGIVHATIDPASGAYDSGTRSR